MPIFGAGSAIGADHGLLSGLLDDDHLQYLLLAGRTGGQVIGSGAHTGGAATDLVLEGRFLLGDNLSGVNFSTGRGIDYRQLCRNATVQANFQYSATGFTGTASGTWTGFQVIVSGLCGYTGFSGNPIMQGFFFTSSAQVPAGVTINESIGGTFQSSANEVNATGGRVNNHYGLRARSWGPLVANANAAHIATSIIGVEGDAANRGKLVDYVICFNAASSQGNNIAATDVAYFAVSTLKGLGHSWVATNLYAFHAIGNGLILGTITNKYGLFIDSFFTKNRLGGWLTIGADADPIHGTDNQQHFGWKTTANKVAAYNAATETMIPCDATAGAFAVNLPTAAGIIGRVYIVKKVDASANAVTVTPNGAETIDGAATSVLAAQWDVVRMISNGTNWLKI